MQGASQDKRLYAKMWIKICELNKKAATVIDAEQIKAVLVVSNYPGIDITVKYLSIQMRLRHKALDSIWIKENNELKRWRKFFYLTWKILTYKIIIKIIFFYQSE